MVPVLVFNSFCIQSDELIQTLTAPFEDSVVGQRHGSLDSDTQSRLEMRADDGLVAHRQRYCAVREHRGVAGELRRIGHESLLATYAFRQNHGEKRLHVALTPSHYAFVVEQCQRQATRCVTDLYNVKTTYCHSIQAFFLSDVLYDKIRLGSLNHVSLIRLLDRFGAFLDVFCHLFSFSIRNIMYTVYNSL